MPPGVGRATKDAHTYRRIGTHQPNARVLDQAVSAFRKAERQSLGFQPVDVFRFIGMGPTAPPRR